jgi:hypothetical protein
MPRIVITRAGIAQEYYDPGYRGIFIFEKHTRRRYLNKVDIDSSRKVRSIASANSGVAERYMILSHGWL